MRQGRKPVSGNVIAAYLLALIISMIGWSMTAPDPRGAMTADQAVRMMCASAFGEISPNPMDTEETRRQIDLQNAYRRSMCGG